MTLVFRTDPDSAEGVEIVGVGYAPPGGVGGVPLELAAQRMAELQTLDDRGFPVEDDDGQPVPLSGAALERAAREWAEGRDVVVDDVRLESEDLVRQTTELAIEAGLPEERPPAAEVAEEGWERTYGGLEPVNQNPEAMVLGDERGGEPAHSDWAAERHGGMATSIEPTGSGPLADRTLDQLRNLAEAHGIEGVDAANRQTVLKRLDEAGVTEKPVEGGGLADGGAAGAGAAGGGGSQASGAGDAGTRGGSTGTTTGGSTAGGR